MKLHLVWLTARQFRKRGSREKTIQIKFIREDWQLDGISSSELEMMDGLFQVRSYPLFLTNLIDNQFQDIS